MKNTARYLLRITWAGRTGLVKAITGFLADRDCFITELFRFDDIQTGRFFCRAEFFKSDSGSSPDQLSEMFLEIGARFEIT